MNKTMMFCVSIGVCLLLAACGIPGSIPEKTMPGIDLPMKDYNNRFRIILLDDETNLKSGDSFFLLTENLFDKPIFHNETQDTRLYIDRNGEWIPIKNGVTYNSGTRMISIFPKTEQISPYIAGVTPIVSDVPPVTIRIVLLGRLGENGSGQLVGAYLDVTLTP